MLTKDRIRYFSHDADMRNDLKIRGLRRKFGNTGYAVWCYFLEVMTDSRNQIIDTDIRSADGGKYDIQLTHQAQKIIFQFAKECAADGVTGVKFNITR